jgi:hypothetical protein
MSSRLSIVVTGLIGQHPGLGGMTWHYLHYVLGLRRLGHDVLYLEDSGEWPYDAAAGRRPCARNVDHVATTMARFGLADRWAFRCAVDRRWHGVPDGRRAALLRSADVLINVSGSLARPSQYRDIPVLVYVDTDPVFAQIKLLRGASPFREIVDAHDVHFTFGERLPVTLRATGHGWRPTRQPVVTSEWAAGTPTRDAYTTVMSWSSYASEEHDGRRFGQKDVELMRFADLPQAVPRSVLELAVDFRPPLGLRPADRAVGGADPAGVLAARGWRIVDAAQGCGSAGRYQDYVRSSRGEWTVAKEAYVAARCGWFSERSACYLAAGRPVIAQDTGFSEVLPVGEGLLAFTSLQEAAEAIREVERDHARHARAARAIAEEHFAAGRVLTRLLDEALDAAAPRPRAADAGDRGGVGSPS